MVKTITLLLSACGLTSAAFIGKKDKIENDDDLLQGWKKMNSQEGFLQAEEVQEHRYLQYDSYNSYGGYGGNSSPYGGYSSYGGPYGGYGGNSSSYGGYGGYSSSYGGYGSYGGSYSPYGGYGGNSSSYGGYSSYGGSYGNSYGGSYGGYGGNSSSYGGYSSYGGSYGNSYGGSYGGYGSSYSPYGSYGGYSSYGGYGGNSSSYGSYGGYSSYGGYGGYSPSYGGYSSYSPYGGYGGNYSPYGNYDSYNQYGGSYNSYDPYGSSHSNQGGDEVSDQAMKVVKEAQKVAGEFIDEKDMPQVNMDNKTYNVKGEGYDITIKEEKGKAGGDQLTSKMKFDKYFMYGVDNMGGKGNGAPECGPGHKHDACKELTKSDKSCCAHVVMTEGNGEQTSMYRCMNERIVDASFSMEVDGMKMSMKCGQTGATYVASAILASMAALVSMTVF